MADIAINLLNTVAEANLDDTTGAMAESNRLVPTAYGLLTMNIIGDCDTPVGSIGPRLYWTEAAGTMGLDYIDAFRTVGAFMKKVESF